MASTARQSAFETNMADAELLVRWAFSIKNSRQRRERAELRQRVGAALDIPQKRRPDIAVVEAIECGELRATGRQELFATADR